MSTTKTTSNSAGVQTSKDPEERILMVDDDPINLQLLRETLKGLGCSLLAVTVARSLSLDGGSSLPTGRG
jgi:response regulator RpfG family c-di-GMP phosphodiesterase